MTQIVGFLVSMIYIITQTVQTVWSWSLYGNLINLETVITDRSHQRNNNTDNQSAAFYLPSEHLSLFCTITTS